MALAIVSGIGTLIDSIVALIIALRLRGPAKEENYDVKTFRGSFFWFFALFIPFALLMSGPLFIKDPVISGYGYTIGHLFLYISTAAYIFAPFSVIAPNRKMIPKVISLLVLLSSIPVTIVNWLGYSSGDNVPEYSNGVALWKPPELVAIYIPLVVGLTYLILGFGVFLYHSLRTKDAFLKRRSRFISIGFLILGISGPLHDQTWRVDIAPIVIGFADFLVALAFVLIAIAVLSRREE